MNKGSTYGLWLLCCCCCTHRVLTEDSISLTRVAVLLSRVSRLHIPLVTPGTGILRVPGSIVGTSIHWVGRSVGVGGAGRKNGNRPGRRLGGIIGAEMNMARRLLNSRHVKMRSGDSSFSCRAPVALAGRNRFGVRVIIEAIAPGRQCDLWCLSVSFKWYMGGGVEAGGVGCCDCLRVETQKGSMQGGLRY